MVIDEVQRVPSVLSVIHKMIEDRGDLLFILTGSSARKLKKEGVNLLGGRAILKKMHPFTAAELGSKFSLVDALQYGLLPLIFSSAEKERKMNAYIDLYMKKEVQMEGLTFLLHLK